MKKAQHADLIMGVLFMLLAAFWFYHASQFRQVEFGIGAGGYPKFVSVGLFFLGLILTVQSIVKGFPKWEVNINWKAILRQVIFFVVTFAYIRLLRHLGFLIATPLYLFFQCWFFGYRKYVIAAIMSVGLTAGLYVVFRMIFFVMLPEFRLF
jgi:hypothetical protein